MMKKKSIAYIVFVVLFVVLISMSTHIVAVAIVGDERFTQSEMSRYQPGSRVYFSIDRIETYDDLKESIYIRGWAFCETEHDNPEKTIAAILKGPDKVYSFVLDAVTRRDVRSAFPEMDLPSMRFGIELHTSTLEVKDGVYELYLYVWENEYDHGLARTGVKIEKSKDYFDVYVPQKVSVSDREILEDEGVRATMDMTADGASLKVSGWGFLSGVDMQECEIYVVLLDSRNEMTFYETAMSRRLDVSRHFQDDRCALSGYAVTIDDPQDAASAVSCTIAVEKDGTYHVSPERWPVAEQDG